MRRNIATGKWRRRDLLGASILALGWSQSSRALALMLPAIAEPGSTHAQAVPANAVRVSDYRRPDDVDDSAAFRRALATGRPVHAPQGGGTGAGGAYLVCSTPDELLPSGAQIIGDGIDRTVIARSYARQAPFIFYADSGSADKERNLRGVLLRDLTLSDEVQKRGFSGYEYMVMLNGVTDAKFERVCCRGFRGDAIHLGSGTSLGVERHNLDVAITDCLFDGVNANNRNAISVIDCDGLRIENCRFLNCSRYGDGTVGDGDPMDPRTGLVMPGPIDLEPNTGAYAVIRSVIINRNYFKGGGGFAVCLNLRANDSLRVPHSDFVITGNIIEDRDGGLVTYGYGGSDAIRLFQPYRVRFEGNSVTRCKTPFILNGMRDIRLVDNRFIDCSMRAEINNAAANSDVVLAGNEFARVGSGDAGYGIWVREVSGLSVIDNNFVDCGLTSRKQGAGIAFVGGTARRVRLEGNRFSSPAGRMTQAVVVGDGRVERSSLSVSQNQIDFTAPTIEQMISASPAA